MASRGSVTASQIRARYDIIDPSKLNKGDIVEVQVSFVVVPIKDKRFKPLIIMRAVTLLDTNPSKASFNQQPQQETDGKQDATLKKRHIQQPKEQMIFRAPILKRSVGYIEDDDEESTEKRMKRLNLNGVPMEL